MTETKWMNDWQVGLRVWVERDGQAVLGEGRAVLLAEIDRHHSITKAAKAAGMSYRRAWSLVQDINAAAAEPLVEAAAGGTAGGGARLTARGRQAMELFERLRFALVESAAGELRRAVHSTSPAPSPTVHLAAAISLQESIAQILTEFALVRPTAQVRTIFGASNELADHALAGAPVDLFISADAAELDRLARANLLAGTTRPKVARNSLAVVGRPDIMDVRKLRDLLSDRVRLVALAEPASPLGRCSTEYLHASGVDEELRPKVLWLDNSRAVVSAVASQTADVGVVFASDANRKGNWRTLFYVPPSKASVTYEAGLIGRHEPSAEATALFEFLGTSKAQRCFRRCGLRHRIK